jgi:hypothetical protein
LRFYKYGLTLHKNNTMTITIEIQNPSLLPKLQSWLRRNDAKAKIVSEGLLFERFDAETQRRVNAYFDSYEKGETIETIDLEDIIATENV